MNCSKTRLLKAASLFVAALTVTSAWFVPRASAGLLVISAPPSVMPGAIQSQTNASIFFESTKTLSAALPVDIITPGTYNLADPDNPGAIAANTRVDSYLLHHESVNNQLSTVIVGGTFPRPILGIMVSDAFLNASDPILGSPTTQYPTGLAYRGLEIPYSSLADAIFWSGNQVFIQVKSTTADVLDQVRIITAASPITPVPEPSSAALAFCGGIGLIGSWLHRRLKR